MPAQLQQRPIRLTWILAAATAIALFLPTPLASYARADDDEYQNEDGEIVAPAPHAPRHARRAETHVRLSSERHILATEIWQPFYQEQDRMLYGNVRFMGDNSDNFEGNLGVGYRQILGKAVYGGYAFLDRRRTSLGSDMWQSTWGGEYIRENWEARANFYLPAKSVNRYTLDGGVPPHLAGTSVYIRTPTTVTEEAQRGGDIEFGMRLPVFERYVADTRAFAGAYHFAGNETENVTGWRTRLTVDATAWLKLGARAQRDEARGDQYFLEATFRFPGLQRNRDNPLWSRLADSPERDVDVITGAEPGGDEPVPMIDPETGAPLHILFVDNATAPNGNGTFEHPFSSLAPAIAKAQPYDVIYIKTGDGTAQGYNSGAVLNVPKVTLWGAGEALYYDGERFAAYTGQTDRNLIPLLGANAHPLLSNPTGDGVTINANNITLRGLQIDAASGNGVTITGSGNNAGLYNTHLTGNDSAGLSINQTGTAPLTVKLRDSLTAGNLGYGIVSQNTGGGVLTLDLGRANDYGLNDIDGNLAGALYAQTGGATVTAQGNYWGDFATLAGADAGHVDRSVAVANPFCATCTVQLSSGFTTLSNVKYSIRQTSNDLVLGGFRGHRYLSVAGTGVPTLNLNGHNTNTTILRAQAGDHIAMALSPSTTGLATRSAILTTPGDDANFSIRTEFMPNALNNLIGWWDGQDVDGDYGTTDNPNTGAPITAWNDKSLRAHNAGAPAPNTPLYNATTNSLIFDGINDALTVANTTTLASLGNGLSFVALVRGTTPTSTPGTILRYGTCSGTGCLSITVDPVTGAPTLRVDTSAGPNQVLTSLSTNLGNGSTHLLWAQALSDGTLRMTIDNNSFSGTYAPGTGFGNTNGLTLGQDWSSAFDEVILFNGNVDAADRALINDYLNEKWDL